MTQGRSHMERNVTKFSLPSITGRITTSLKKRRKDVVQLPSITGRITTSLKKQRKDVVQLPNISILLVELPHL